MLRFPSVGNAGRYAYLRGGLARWVTYASHRCATHTSIAHARSVSVRSSSNASTTPAKRSMLLAAKRSVLIAPSYAGGTFPPSGFLIEPCERYCPYQPQAGERSIPISSEARDTVSKRRSEIYQPSFPIQPCRAYRHFIYRLRPHVARVII